MAGGGRRRRAKRQQVVTTIPAHAVSHFRYPCTTVGTAGGRRSLLEAAAGKGERGDARSNDVDESAGHCELGLAEGGAETTREDEHTCVEGERRWEKVREGGKG